MWTFQVTDMTKVSKTERAAWGKMIETYFTTREQLDAAVLVVDLRPQTNK